MEVLLNPLFFYLVSRTATFLSPKNSQHVVTPHDVIYKPHFPSSDAGCMWLMHVLWVNAPVVGVPMCAKIERRGHR